MFKQKRFQKILFIATLSIQLILMLTMSFNIGISGDEFRHHEQAEKVYNYYATKGENQLALKKTGIDPMQYNGQSFDNLMYVFEKAFNVKDYMTMRHFFNALIGWLIILMTGLIAKEFWGYKGAILAIFLLFISPRFLGHALNNNKDIPFAFGFIFSFYWMIHFLKELPKPRIRTLLFLTFGIAFAISIRLAGILSIGFLGLFSAVYYFIQKPVKFPFTREKMTLLKRLFIYIPAIAVIGYLLGIIFWPYMLTNPIQHFKVVMDAMSSHPVSLSQLFEGKIYSSNKLPHDYTFVYVVYTYPLIILIGILLALTQFVSRYKKDDWFYQFIIIFSFFFVIFWMSFENSNIYGGIRHLLFIYPLAIVLTVLGLRFVKDKMDKLQKSYTNYVFITVLLILSFNPIKHIIKNHQYSYIYFNEIAGGIDKAGYNYESDYFQHSLRPTTEWLISNEIDKINPTDTTRVKIIANDFKNVNYFLRPVQNKVTLNYTRYYEKSTKDWDYAILYCSYISPSDLKNKHWPPKGTIHTENVDGFPIAAVVKRISHEDYKGFEALKKRNLPEAKNHFQAYLKLDPQNEEVLSGMAAVFERENKTEKAVAYADTALSYNPRLISALFAKANALIKAKRYSEALEVCNNLIDIKESIAEAHFLKGVSLRGLKQPNTALKEFQLATKYKKEYYQAFMAIGNILVNYKKYNEAIEKIYKPVLRFKKNDFFATISVAKCFYFMRNNVKAQEILDKNIPKNFQNHLETVMLKCRLAMDQGNMNQAGYFLNMARYINNNSELDVIRTLFELKMNNIPLANQFIAQAIKIDPINREALDLQKRMKQPTSPVKQQAQQAQRSILFQNNKKSNSKTNPLINK